MREALGRAQSTHGYEVEGMMCGLGDGRSHERRVCEFSFFFFLFLSLLSGRNRTWCVIVPFTSGRLSCF
jgi:hypothetical protein